MYPCPDPHDNLFHMLPPVGEPAVGAQIADDAQVEPMISTHRVTYSDRLKVFIGPSERVQNFLRPMRKFDGHHRYSLCLSRLPKPMPASEIPASVSAGPGSDYLHCMGSADALVLELHTTVDGQPRRYTVGGQDSYRAGDPELAIVIQHGEHILEVHPDEIFTADEAAEIFTTYYRTGDIPAELGLREQGGR